MLTIYHNPRCGKSRECLAFLENTSHEIQVVKYLDTKFDFDSLSEILEKLNYKPIDLVRQKEKIWIENLKSKTLSDDEIINAMVDFPVLIERPIVVVNEKAVVARPLEKVILILYLFNFFLDL